MTPIRILREFEKAFPEYKDKAEKAMAVKNAPNDVKLYFYDGRILYVERIKEGRTWRITVTR